MSIYIKNNKVVQVIVFFNIVFLTVLIFFTPFVIHVFRLETYDFLYEKNSVYDSLDQNDVFLITENLFDFFRHRDEIRKLDFQEEFAFFEPDEISHLEDVRVLFDAIFILYIVSAVLLTVLTLLFLGQGVQRFLQRIGYVLLGGSISVISILLLLFFLSQNFMYLFENFHLVFFPQGNYTFLETSLLITLFPMGFFYDFFMHLVIQSLLISAVLLVASVLMLLLLKYKTIKGRS